MKQKEEGRSRAAADGNVTQPDRVDALETFIEQLHAEGVELGRQEAARLRAAAQAEAAAVIARAEESARQLIAEAEKKARALQAETHSDLALAVRDSQLELRDKLSRALTTLLQQSVERELGDPAFLQEVLRELIVAYAAAAGLGAADAEVHVRPEAVDKLTSALSGMLGQALTDATKGLDVKGTLRTAGFEYHVDNFAIEVTPESVAEKLAQLVTPRLRSLLREAVGEESLLMPAGKAHDNRAAPVPSNQHSGSNR